MRTEAGKMPESLTFPIKNGLGVSNDRFGIKQKRCVKTHPDTPPIPYPRRNNIQLPDHCQSADGHPAPLFNPEHVLPRNEIAYRQFKPAIP